MYKISVIIPAKNEEKNIGNCLRAIKKQRLKPIECIVIDNGSKDKTTDIALKEGAIVIVKENVNIGELRNLGAATAKGDIFAFLDADCVPEEDWLEMANEVLLGDKIGAVGNTVLPINNKNWIEKAWYFNLKQRSGEVKYIGSANLIVKKKVFEEILGFDTYLKAGEDRELCWKIQKHGYKTIHDDRINVKHLRYPKNILEFFKREFWHGKAIISDMNNLNKSRILYIIIFYNLLFLTLIAFILLNKLTLSFISLLLIFALPFAISLAKAIKKRSYKYVVQLFFLYLIYLISRSISFYIAFYHIFKSMEHRFSLRRKKVN